MTGIIRLFLESSNSVIVLYLIVTFLTLYFEMQYKTGEEPIWTHLTRFGFKNKLWGEPHLTTATYKPKHAYNFTSLLPPLPPL